MEPADPVWDKFIGRNWYYLARDAARSDLVGRIVATVETEAQARDLINTLAMQDWAGLLGRKSFGLSQRMASEYYWEGRCSVCERLIPRSALREQVYPGSKYGMLCPECELEARERYVRQCEACGSEYIERYGRGYSICPDCLNKRWVYQAHVVSGNNSRTRQLGLESSLTPSEWFRTLKAFNWRCAYCGKEAGLVLDHLRPVSMGGGTTARNCVPACAACNGSKLASPPDVWLHPDVYKRVMAKMAEIHPAKEEACAGI